MNMMMKSKEDSSSLCESTTKTCPICKAFSSATLNAHIDHCLSSGSNSMLKRSRGRGRPRMKVKTMVDIYASAKECTLEELDRRNGTKWSSSVSSYTNKVVDDKSKKKRKVGFGPVYTEAKDQKLLNLSESSEKKTCKSPLSKGNLSKIRNQREGSSTVVHRRRIYNQRMLAKCSLMSKMPSDKGHELDALREKLSKNDDDSVRNIPSEQTAVLKEDLREGSLSIEELTNPLTGFYPYHPFEHFSSRRNLNGIVPPSPSNTVFRLMGKDLIVMNQGESDQGRSLTLSTNQLVDISL